MPGKIQELIYRIVWDDGDASKKKAAWDRKMKNSSKLAQDLQKAFLKMGAALGRSLTVDAIKNFAIFEDALGHARRTMGRTDSAASTCRATARSASWSDSLRATRPHSGPSGPG